MNNFIGGINHPINEKTTFEEMGAESLSDISLTDLLFFVKMVCLNVSKDYKADEELKWGDDFAEAAGHLQSAIEILQRWDV